MKAICWNKDMLEFLSTNYSVMSIDSIADTLGVSRETVKRKIKQLGLTKRKRISSLPVALIVKEGYDYMSYSELALKTGLSRSAVVRLSKSMGLSRTKENNSAIRSRVRKEISRRDRLRIKVGMPPLTRIIERN